MASPATSSSVMPPQSTVISGGTAVGGCGGPLGAGPPPPLPPVGAPGGNPMYMLQWHEHHASFFRLMEDLCREQSLTDVTITCGDVSLEAHSLILGASSPILRSILAKGEGKKQTLHFMDMNPYHMQLLLQYMYRGEISVPQIELAPLMASARSLQVKGLCSAGPGGGTPGVNTASGLNIIDPPAISLPPPTPTVHTQNTPPTLPTDRLSEFANYLAANTQPQPISSSNLIMPPGDLQPLDASGLINLEPPQQPVIMVNNTVSVASHAASNKKKRSSAASVAASNAASAAALAAATANKTPNGGQNGLVASTASENKNGVSASKKRKTKKPFEELRRPVNNGCEQPQNGDHLQTPDSSGSIKHLAHDVHDGDGDLADHVDGNGVGGIAENWSDQQTIKVKGHRIPVLPKPLSQMKTTETRSYLSRLIWATNGWKRPQYGNPETKPVWWPNELLNWAEMKKMGGKKADGLSNVNYNEIQKTILQEGYKYFGFDPETLCHIKTGSDLDSQNNAAGHGNGPIGNSHLDQLLNPAGGLRTPLPASALMGQPITLVKSEDGFGVVRSSPPLPPSVAALAAAGAPQQSSAN